MLSGEGWVKKEIEEPDQAEDKKISIHVFDNNRKEILMNAKQLFKIRTYLVMKNTTEANEIVAIIDYLEKTKDEIVYTVNKAKSQLTTIQKCVESEDSTEELNINSAYALEDLNSRGFHIFYENRRELNQRLDQLVSNHGGLEKFMETINNLFVNLEK